MDRQIYIAVMKLVFYIALLLVVHRLIISHALPISQHSSTHIRGNNHASSSSESDSTLPTVSNVDLIQQAIVSSFTTAVPVAHISAAIQAQNTPIHSQASSSGPGDKHHSKYQHKKKYKHHRHHKHKILRNAFGGGHLSDGEEEEPHSEVVLNSTEFWLRIGLIFGLLMIAGLMAGLTIGIMALDSNYLHILKISGTPKERYYASIVEPLRKRGHLLLSTLLLANMLANETLPIILDDLLSGGLMAVIVSTGLIVLFAEIIPQAVCAKYGLAIGAYSAWIVKLLMVILFPITWPIAKTLEWILGEHQGTLYRRSELKEFVALHGKEHSGELDSDEIRIIKSVLDLKLKTTKDSMTPLDDVFMLSMDSRLDFRSLQLIKSAGYSRIPIFVEKRENIVGVLLAKDLLGIHDVKLVRDLRYMMRPIIYFSVDDSCFTVMDKLIEARAHFAAVYSPNVYAESKNIESAPARLQSNEEEVPLNSENTQIGIEIENGHFSSQNHETIISNNSSSDKLVDTTVVGIITLEDVMEEMIGEEIVDETDLYIDSRTKEHNTSLVRHTSVSGSYRSSSIKRRRMRSTKRKHRNLFRSSSKNGRKKVEGVTTGYSESMPTSAYFYKKPSVSSSTSGASSSALIANIRRSVSSDKQEEKALLSNEDKEKETGGEGSGSHKSKILKKARM